MRPTVTMLGTAAVLAALAAPIPGAAQDTTDRRARDVSARVVGADRAALGVSLAPSRGRDDTLGVRVLDVTDGGPAEKAGVEAGDRIIAIDGTTLRVDAADAEDPMFRDLASRRLQRALAKRAPGDEVSLVVQRGQGDRRTVRVKTVAAADLSSARAYAYGFGPGGATVMHGPSARAWADSARARAERRPALGVTIGASGSRRDTLGLFVSAVSPDGPAERAGIVEGARIASINGVDLRASRDDVDDPDLGSLVSRRFTREIEKARPGDDVTLRVWQNGATRAVTVKAGRAADVYANRRGVSFSFGDGDGALVMPPMPPRAPLAPLAPAAPRPPHAPLMPVPRIRILETSSDMPAARTRAVAVTRTRRTVER